MKIKRIKLLSQFRGLPPDYEITFNSSQEKGSCGISPICFIGINGSGKSNVLEVIAEIFYFLEAYHSVPKDKLNSFKKQDFGFEIEYELPRLHVMENSSWDDLKLYLATTKSNPIIKIIKQAKRYAQLSAEVDEKKFSLESDNGRNKGLLPALIVAYSSGMNELLSNPFIRIDFRFHEVKKANWETTFDVKNEYRSADFL